MIYFLVCSKHNMVALCGNNRYAPEELCFFFFVKNWIFANKLMLNIHGGLLFYFMGPFIIRLLLVHLRYIMFTYWVLLKWSNIFSDYKILYFEKKYKQGKSRFVNPFLHPEITVDISIYFLWLFFMSIFMTWEYNDYIAK